MDNFLITLATVIMLFAYALPGYLLIKTKVVKESALSALSYVLMYICQPALTIYSFDQATQLIVASPESASSLYASMAAVFGIAFVGIILLMVTFYFIFRKKFDDIMNRLYIICTCFGNVAFFGNPIMLNLLPNHPEAVIFSTVFFIAMNIIGWTLGCYLITQDKKYISIKKVVLNPAVLALIVALPLFIFKVQLASIGGEGSMLGSRIYEFMSLLAKMTTPICMIILGMRLATLELKHLFIHWKNYCIIAVKHIVFPFVLLLMIYFLPIATYVKQIVFILGACPCAAIIQTYAEMLEKGQKESVQMVLLSTMLSVVTLPLLMLIPLF